MADFLEKELISPEAVRRTCQFLVPRVLATACLTGLLVAEAAFAGTITGIIDVDFREYLSHHVREDLMWGLFLSQLVILVPASLWLWTRKWHQVCHDSRAQTWGRALVGAAILAVCAFLSLGASAISARIYRFDYEFLGVSFMHLGMALAMFQFLRKYRLDPGSRCEVENASEIPLRTTAMRCIGIIIVCLTLSVVCALIHDGIILKGLYWGR